MNTGLVDAFEVPQSAIHLIRLLARPATDEAIQRGAHGVDGALIVRKAGSTAKEAQHRLIQRYSLLPRQSANAVGQFGVESSNRQLMHRLPLG